jgi:hypothetical protein
MFSSFITVVAVSTKARSTSCPHPYQQQQLSRPTQGRPPKPHPYYQQLSRPTQGRPPNPHLFIQPQMSRPTHGRPSYQPRSPPGPQYRSYQQRSDSTLQQQRPVQSTQQQIPVQQKCQSVLLPIRQPHQNPGRPAQLRDPITCRHITQRLSGQL